MDKAIKIIESEIAQRETANQIKSNLRFEIIKEEVKQLKKVLELVNKTNDIHSVSCSKCGEPIKRSVAQWTCINQLCSGETKYDN